MTRWRAVGRGGTYQWTDGLIVSPPSDGDLEIRRSPWTPLTNHLLKFNARGMGGFLLVPQNTWRAPCGIAGAQSETASRQEWCGEKGRFCCVSRPYVGSSLFNDHRAVDLIESDGCKRRPGLKR